MTSSESSPLERRDSAGAAPSFRDVLVMWVERRENLSGGVSDVEIAATYEGGTCGEGTCWYDAEVELRFIHDGSARQQTYYIKPGDFVAELAALAATPASASIAGADPKETP